MCRHSNTVAVLSAWLFHLAWAVWFGGLIVLGAVSAPGIFQTARRWPDELTAPTVFRFAGIAAGAGFRRFNSLALGCGMVLILAGSVAWLLDRRRPRFHTTRLALVAVCLAISGWLTLGMFPEMDRLRLAGDMTRFDAMHRAYAHWSILQAWLLLAVGGISAWMGVIGSPRDGQSGDFVAVSGPESPRMGPVLLEEDRITPIQLLQARAHLHHRTNSYSWQGEYAPAKDNGLRRILRRMRR